MSLKELTKASHTAAEKTKFMKAVFSGNMKQDVWADFLYQKSLFYNAIESCADLLNIIDDVPGIRRSKLLLDDYNALSEYRDSRYKKVTLDYYRYITALYPDREKLLAHLYTWHMGDLHGGQMIKKVLPFSHNHLEFENREELINSLRAKLNDNMSEEANIAFDWAIKIMKEYDAKFDV